MGMRNPEFGRTVGYGSRRIDTALADCGRTGGKAEGTAASWADTLEVTVVQGSEPRLCIGDIISVGISFQGNLCN